jgi:hypothetical protein
MPNKNLSGRQLLAATACVLLATAAGANAYNDLGDGQGYLIDAASWDAGVFNVDLDVQKYFYLRTVEDLAAASAGGYVLLQNPVNSVSPAVMKTYTSATDIAAIKAWLEAQPDQNATNLQISTTDDDTVEPGSVDTSSWTNVGFNLQPFSVTSACNTTAVNRASAALSAMDIPAACATDVVNLLKAHYAAPAGTNCLGYASFLLTNWQKQCRAASFVNSFSTFCTDGVPGATALRDYILSMAPPGAVGYGAVYSADADGAAVTLTPAPLGATNTPSGAADGVPAFRAATAVAVIAVLSAMMAL